MESGIQTSNGKAFEYACIIAICAELGSNQKIVIMDSAPMITAQGLYQKIRDDLKEQLDSAAYAAIRVIKRLEPQLCEAGGNEPLYISLQADGEGAKGDVRDVLCMRKQNGWEIGLSCKHNHHAVKHSRLSDTIDFGLDWLGIPCSEQYFSEVVPIFTKLRNVRDNSKDTGTPVLWSEIEDKAEHYYIPILNAFIKELQQIASSSNENIPEKLIRYLIGKKDFYKEITDDTHRTTRVEAVNLSGTLNICSGDLKTITKVPLLKMPTQFYHIGFKSGSDNTIEVVCDEGWQISMRIHSASSRVEPSLKFDVNLISMPSSMHSQVEPWDNEKEILKRVRLSEYKKRML